jgi:hypothetical protein
MSNTMSYQDSTRKVNKPIRYLVERTDYHWDKIWGIKDLETNRFLIFKDVIRHFVVTEANRLNKEWQKEHGF